MGKTVRYGAIDFAPDFRCGTNALGVAIKFTKPERLLLAKFSQNAGVILSRDRLLDAASGPGSDAIDRNVDFVINRLRRKLADSARSPTYIETRYGEGYVWIAGHIELVAKSSGAFLVIGPVRGLQYAGRFTYQAQSCAEQLRSLLERKMAKERRVVLDEDCPAAEKFIGEKPAFAVELNLLDVGDRLDCAAIVRAYATGQILRALRYTVAGGETGRQPSERKGVESSAEEIAAAIWDTLAYPHSHLAASGDVLAVRMYAASELFTNETPWLETDRRLRKSLANNNNDFRARLMLATNLHSKYLLSGMILPEADNRIEDEDEMETLVLSSLSPLQENPIFMMAAATLLYFLDRGHRPLAIDIAEKAFCTTTAFATSFAMFGQMRMFEGEIGEALAMFDRGLELVPDGSHFERYLLILKCQALLASGKRRALSAAFDALCQRDPRIRSPLSVIFTSAEPGEILPEAQHLADNIDERRARAMLLWAHYISARLFRSEEHRAAILMPSVQLLGRRFGPNVVPVEVKVSVPTLLGIETARTDKAATA
jgi:hypothetical protein